MHNDGPLKSTAVITVSHRESGRLLWIWQSYKDKHRNPSLQFTPGPAEAKVSVEDISFTCQAAMFIPRQANWSSTFWLCLVSLPWERQTKLPLFSTKLVLWFPLVYSDVINTYICYPRARKSLYQHEMQKSLMERQVKLMCVTLRTGRCVAHVGMSLCNTGDTHRYRLRVSGIQNPFRGLMHTWHMHGLGSERVPPGS